MFKVIKVTGNSLSPFFLPGDYVVTLTCRWLLRNLSAGDVIVFRHPEYGQMVKKVNGTNQKTGTISVRGVHPESLDSRQFGPISSDNVIGKVIWHISQQ